MSSTTHLRPAMPPDAEQLRTFVRAMLKHATPHYIVSLRAFPQGRAGRPIFVRPFEIEADDDLESIIGGAVAGARDASKRNAVFSPPIASFRDVGKASEADLAEGFTISVECDAFPRTALAKLVGVIGPPTLVVASGGQWTDPETGEVQDKLHLHWVLKTPAADTASLTKLKQARAFATAIAGADPSCVPVNHPMRWPGSWHLKDPNNPRLCRITEHSAMEVDLDAALEELRAAAPPAAIKVAVTTTVHRARARLRDRRWSLEPPVSIAELASAMRAIPNANDEWKAWKDMALRLYAATRGDESGFEIFDDWSKQSPKYDAENTRAEWKNIQRSPPNRTGAGKIFAIAREHGWRAEPKAPLSSKTVHNSPIVARTKRHAALPHLDAVARIEDEIRFFVDKVVINGERSPYTDLYIEGKTGSRDSPRSWAIVGPPGTYKSSITRKLVAERLKSGELQKVVFLVPRLKFADEYIREFARLGIKAEVLRGRSARNEFGEKMCWELARVAIAELCGIKVSDHVCKECPHLGSCPYTQQMEIESQVWIAASNYLFHDQKVLKGADCVIIDEGFHSRGIIDDLERHAIPLDALALQSGHRLDLIPQQLLRRRLYDVLQRQEDDGGVEQGAIDEAFGDNWEGTIIGSTDELKRAEIVERKVLDSVLLPQLKRLLASGTARGLKRLMRSELVRDIRHTQTMIKVWRELRDFVDMVSYDKSDNPIRSGRVLRESYKEADDASKFLVWRGISRITGQFQVPTLLLNVEHEEKIVEVFIPQIESPVVVDVAMPAATKIVQVLGAPTTKTKLGDPDCRKPNFEERLRAVDANRQEVLAYIIKHWRNLGNPKAAVFCQLDYHRWLEDKLPEGIVVEHFGNVAGTNNFADVGLEFIVGRALPGPRAVETAASTLSGLQVETIIDPNPKVFSWYLAVPGEIRLRGGGAAVGRGHRHPDPLADANLRSILSELQQAIGRARPWGRDESRPLTVHLLLDEAIPSAIVDDIQQWPEAGPFDALIEVGILPASEVDLMRLWPETFTSVRTTRRYLKTLQISPEWQCFTYRPTGRRGRLPQGWYNPTRIQDPQAWLIEKIGPLSIFTLADEKFL